MAASAKDSGAPPLPPRREASPPPPLSPPPLSFLARLTWLNQHLTKIWPYVNEESGKDSQERKKNYIKSLLVAATDCEPLYLIRLLQTKLRIGLAEQTLLAALGQAAVYIEKHSKPPPNIQSSLEENCQSLMVSL